MSSILITKLRLSDGTGEPSHVEKQIGRRFLDVLYFKAKDKLRDEISSEWDTMSVATSHSGDTLQISDAEVISVMYHLPKLHEEALDVKQLYEIQYADMTEGYQEYTVYIGKGITHIRLPQQPYIVKCGALDIDCSLLPVQISSNAQIESLKIVRHKSVNYNSRKFFIGTRDEEYDIDFGIKYYADVNILHMPTSYALRHSDLIAAYTSQTSTCDSVEKARSWLMSLYDSQPINSKTSCGNTYIGAFLLKEGVAYMSQTK